MTFHPSNLLHFFRCLLLLSIASSSLVAAPQRGSDTKWIKNLKPTKCDDTIKKYQGKGMIPVDAKVDSNGKRVRVSLCFETPPKVHEKKPICIFDIPASEYDRKTEQAAKGKYKVHWQEEYTLKGETYHACIWYYDRNYEAPAEMKTRDEAPKPPAKPLGKIWNVDSKVPTHGDGHRAYANLEKEAILFLKANQLPGGSIACSLKGKTTYMRAFGFADVDRKKALKVNQPMRIAGISRLITAVAVLQLADRGKLKLDEKAFKLLDHIKPWKPEDVDDNIYSITVLHLLQDSGGYDERRTNFIPGIYPRTIAGEMGLKQPITNDQVISYMMSKSLAFEPGTQGVYSDFGYCLLGRIIEEVSGMPYVEYVEKNIIKPYKLGFQMGHGDLARRAKNEPMYYKRAGDFFYQVTGKDLNRWVQWPDGGINLDLLDASAAWIGTTDDILKLAVLLQTSEADPSWGRVKPLLSDAARVQLVAKPDYFVKDPKGKEYWKGCSVSCRDYVGGRTFWTQATQAGASSELTCFANGITYCHLWNCTTTESGSAPSAAFAETVKKEAFSVKRALLGE